MVGEVMFYGPGAGKLPTASAVVADIIDVIAHRDAELKVISWKDADESDLADFDGFACKRVFISSKELSLPCVKQAITKDECFAYLTDELTEAEVANIKAGNADSIISVFRAL